MWSEAVQEEFPEALHRQVIEMERGGQEEFETDCSGSFIDDSISDHVNLNSDTYAASDASGCQDRHSEVSGSAETLEADTHGVSCVFQAEMTDTCVFQADANGGGEARGGCRAIIDLQRGDIQYENECTSC